MYAHIHATLLAGRHDSLEEVFHVFAQLLLVYSFIQIEELAELLDRSLVVLAKVAADEALRLDDDILYQLMVFLGRHRFSQLIALG